MKLLRPLIAVFGLSAILSGQAVAGNMFLTGHDILSHSKQNGYDQVILNYLRGQGTGSEIAAADYDIGLINSGSITGFGSVTTHSSFFATETEFTNFLAGIDVLVIEENLANDGGFLNTYNSAFVTWFNAGGDVWADTSNGVANYYSWLPAGATADGPGINFSSGFSATAAGAAIGIQPNMVNGFPTHNRFTSWASAFTVFETHQSFPNDAVSIGFRDGNIGGGGIQVPNNNQVPEPATLALMGLGILGAGLSRRKRRS